MPLPPSRARSDSLGTRVRNRRRHLLIALGCVVTSLAAYAGPPATTAQADPAGQLVSEVAAPGTPHVLDGEVDSVVQVGNTVILGGTFTKARNDGSGEVLPRNRLL